MNKKIKQYLHLDRDIDELGWSDETIVKICKKIVNTMLELKLMDKEDLQHHNNEIDYGATANDECAYMSDEDKELILTHLKK